MAGLGNVHLKWLQPSSLYSQMWCFFAGLCAPSARWVCLQNDLMLPCIWKTFRDLISWAIPCTRVLCPEINQGFFLEKKKKSQTKPAGVGTGGMLKPGQLLVCSSSCLNFCHEIFPPRGYTNVLVVESELGLFRRVTLLPLKWPLSWMGWWGNECVCVCVRVLVCPVKRAFRWRNAASDLFGYLWRSWQTWTSSLAGRKKDRLFPKYQRKAWCRWGLHQWNVAGSRSCRCCPWPWTCTSWVGLEKEGCQSPHRTAVLSQRWMKKMFQCCGWIWVVCHGGQKDSYKIPFT